MDPTRRSPHVTGNGRVGLEAAVHEGDLVVEASDCVVQGASLVATVIRGSLVVRGHDVTVRMLSVEGDVRIVGDDNRIEVGLMTPPSGAPWPGDVLVEGSDNHVRGVERELATIRGDVVVRGNDNHVRGMKIRGRARVSGDYNDVEGAPVASLGGAWVPWLIILGVAVLVIAAALALGALATGG